MVRIERKLLVVSNRKDNQNLGDNRLYNEKREGSRGRGINQSIRDILLLFRTPLGITVDSDYRGYIFDHR